jgi:hypothetical protein
MMEDFILYSVRTSICASILFSGYWLFLKRDTFLRTKRFILLGIIVASFLLPLFRLPSKEISVIAKPAITLETTLQDAARQPQSSPPYVSRQGPERQEPVNYLKVLYWTGFSIQLVLLLASLLHVFLIIRRSEKSGSRLGRFFRAPRGTTPFSWGRIVVVPAVDYPDEGEEILLHEFSHKQLLHFIDLAMAEIFITVNWYNPFAWFIRHEMKLNHEFEADKKAVSQGADITNYQLSLVRAVAGERKFKLANQFASSTIKTRIHMMKKQKSTTWAYLKVILFIPLVALIILGFSKPLPSQSSTPARTGSGYLRLTPEQLKTIGIVCNEDGVFYKNRNPHWKQNHKKYPVLAFYLTGSTYCAIVTLEENEKFPELKSAKFLTTLPETTHPYDPCLVTSFSGFRTWDSFTVLGDSTMKLLPVQLNMADYGIKSRKDTIVFWFQPVESLKKALAPYADISAYLVTPPSKPSK